MELRAPMTNWKFSLNAIPSQARFVIYSVKDGLVSEHDRVADAMRKLAVVIGADFCTHATIYERLDEWIRIM
jgi:hypothetical protein